MLLCFIWSQFVRPDASRPNSTINSAKKQSIDRRTERERERDGITNRSSNRKVGGEESRREVNSDQMFF